MSPLAAALDEVATALGGAHDPWWVIGSAAAWLHGVETPVADVDVLLSRRDALVVATAWRGEKAVRGPSDRFRSSPFVRLEGASLPIELMAALHVCSAGRWLAVRPRTRQSIGPVYVPEPAELEAMFTLFGRPKDDERAGLLRTIVDRSSAGPR
ncbi:hypothetical protein K7957_04495 [Sphingomonas yunnanensis]|uniref:hypothetical protein n=1 Tax=Sphingomonas yunnanensis TaxID=310400 RepID=UPI001CA61C78|nr:hypothetical protein [Sphingomonas yunnanensis]MBY9062186.1 hypothetical protein [Sphingomonas yunnanensis]